MAQMADLTPTILEYCGAEIPSTVQGRSLAPILRGEADEVDNGPVFIETPRFQIGVRTRRHVYGMQIDRETREITNDRLLFYDFQEDPYEESNLIDSGEQAEVARKLRGTLREWHSKTPWLSVDETAKRE
jgi:arylsulfatase A-like enzyme